MIPHLEGQLRGTVHTVHRHLPIGYRAAAGPRPGSPLLAGEFRGPATGCRPGCRGPAGNRRSGTGAPQAPDPDHPSWRASSGALPHCHLLLPIERQGAGATDQEPKFPRKANSPNPLLVRYFLRGAVPLSHPSELVPFSNVHRMELHESSFDGWFAAQTSLKYVSLVQSSLMQLRCKLVVYYQADDGCPCEQEKRCV
jgi:hypothetical protein